MHGGEQPENDHPCTKCGPARVGDFGDFHPLSVITGIQITKYKISKPYQNIRVWKSSKYPLSRYSGNMWAMNPGTVASIIVYKKTIAGNNTHTFMLAFRSAPTYCLNSVGTDEYFRHLKNHNGC